jgi:homoserine dehydrogenase
MLVGFGHVGRRFATLLEESREALAALGIETRVVGIVTRRHGAAFDTAGLDAARAARIVTDGGAFGTAPTPSALELISRWRPDVAAARVLVETTPLDVRSGEPAVSHIRAAFAAGIDVVTANKGPIACAYRSLSDEAARTGRQLRFEGAVMDGIPIFNLVRETMPAATIAGFRGVVNSTTNFLIDAMERGEPFDAALARMQADGVAEADASLDVDGWDAAAKVAAMANVWFDARITPADVARESVTSETGERARAARAAGRRLKVVAQAQRRGEAAVRLEELPADDPLAILDGQANALEIDSWPLGRIVITQRDGGLEKTAYALLSDIVNAVKGVGTLFPHDRKRVPTPFPRFPR